MRNAEQTSDEGNKNKAKAELKTQEQKNRPKLT